MVVKYVRFIYPFVDNLHCEPMAAHIVDHCATNFISRVHLGGSIKTFKQRIIIFVALLSLVQTDQCIIRHTLKNKL